MCNLCRPPERPIARVYIGKTETPLHVLTRPPWVKHQSRFNPGGQGTKISTAVKYQARESLELSLAEALLIPIGLISGIEQHDNREETTDVRRVIVLNQRDELSSSLNLF
ncbi:hypothetical protein ACOME3_003843 [Neoechinorhynchus agilis]